MRQRSSIIIPWPCLPWVRIRIIWWTRYFPPGLIRLQHLQRLRHLYQHPNSHPLHQLNNLQNQLYLFCHRYSLSLNIWPQRVEMSKKSRMISMCIRTWPQLQQGYHWNHHSHKPLLHLPFHVHPLRRHCSRINQNQRWLWTLPRMMRNMIRLVVKMTTKVTMPMKMTI